MAQLCETPTRGATGSAEVLIVDDDPNHRELYARRLERLGFTVRTAACADEAIETVGADRPQAIVLDIAMPGRDGLSALQEFIAMDPSLPVIIHTAYPTFRDNFLAWAADDYVDKSSDLQPLVNAIKAAVHRSVVA